ncbi:MAG TPA: hypothetical protein VHS31_09960 [Tepidisphaeraceae bacterium]|jgi:hypothetical protein|nr:hypothetical protein [Tepidisphaeraceae bacterium]
MSDTSSPIDIEGPEQSRVDPTLADAGLPPAVGVQSYQVFRASRAVPEMTDGRGWTYHHHVDMACWRGRLYVAWNSCEQDEDVWPSRELYSTSTDGIEWPAPRELFPQGVSTPLRMYFFLAPNGRMLVIAGLRADREDTDEDKKGGIVVREIFADHQLGDVFTLRLIGSPPNAAPMFDGSSDGGFVEACRSLLANKIYLEQQDRGRLLGERRMKWHNATAWPGGMVPGDDAKWVCGKGFSFFRRTDGTRLGLCKMGYVTTSIDEGESWAMPVIPPTLVTGKAKVWSQRTADRRFALVYNPSRKNRFPLIVVTSDDGVHFRDMRIVQGELPVQRYPGKFRSIGPQYVRGISEWADDHSREEQVMWLVYSMSKEDIWVSRVPLPVKADEMRGTIQGFDDWNLYVPKWASVSVSGGEMRIENRDPHDYVRVTRVFSESDLVKVSFDLLAEQLEQVPLEIEFMSKMGARRELRISSGDLRLAPGEWVSIEIHRDAGQGQCKIMVNGKIVRDGASDEAGHSVNRISFRTGAYRNIGGANPVPLESDRPMRPSVYRIRNFRLEARQSKNFTA